MGFQKNLALNNGVTAGYFNIKYFDYDRDLGEITISLNYFLDKTSRNLNKDPILSQNFIFTGKNNSFFVGDVLPLMYGLIKSEVDFSDAQDA